MQYNSYVVSGVKTALSLPASFDVYSKKTFSLKNIRKKAFTLAETLITLSIIGVIAAITVPTLMSNVNKQIYVVGLKKAYSQLSNAMKMIPIAENCPSDDYVCAGVEYRTNLKFFDQEKLPSAIASQLKARPFIDPKYKIVTGTGSKVCTSESNGCYITDDGMIFGSYYPTGFGDYIFFDVDGTKSKQTFGRDVFVFTIAAEGCNGRAPEIRMGTVIPNGAKLHERCYYNGAYWRNTSAKDGISGNPEYDQHLTGRVLEENGMKY